MNHQIYFLTVFALSFFSNCNNNRSIIETFEVGKEDYIIQKFYYGDDIIAERGLIITNKDTMIHGYKKTFYTTGQLRLFVQYQYGKKQGEEKGFYKNGLLEHSGWYNADKQDSLWVWYYDYSQVTKIQAMDFWSNGNPLSHQLKYYFNGNVKEYLFYDPIGRLIYKRKYEEGGNYKDEGSKYPQIVMVNEKKNQFSKEDVLKARIYHIMPPRTETTTYVRIIGLQEEWKEISSASYYTPIIFETKISKVGNYKLELKLKLKDKQKTEIFEFVNQVEFTVR